MEAQSCRGLMPEVALVQAKALVVAVTAAAETEVQARALTAALVAALVTAEAGRGKQKV